MLNTQFALFAIGLGIAVVAADNHTTAAPTNAPSAPPTNAPVYQTNDGDVNIIINGTLVHGDENKTYTLDANDIFTNDTLGSDKNDSLTNSDGTTQFADTTSGDDYTPLRSPEGDPLSPHRKWDSDSGVLSFVSASKYLQLYHSDDATHEVSYETFQESTCSPGYACSLCGCDPVLDFAYQDHDQIDTSKIQTNDTETRHFYARNNGVTNLCFTYIDQYGSKDDTKNCSESMARFFTRDASRLEQNNRDLIYGYAETLGKPGGDNDTGIYQDISGLLSPLEFMDVSNSQCGTSDGSPCGSCAIKGNIEWALSTFNAFNRMRALPDLNMNVHYVVVDSPIQSTSEFLPCPSDYTHINYKGEDKVERGDTKCTTTMREFDVQITCNSNSSETNFLPHIWLVNPANTNKEYYADKLDQTQVDGVCGFRPPYQQEVHQSSTYNYISGHGSGLKWDLTPSYGDTSDTNEMQTVLDNREYSVVVTYADIIRSCSQNVANDYADNIMKMKTTLYWEQWGDLQQTGGGYANVYMEGLDNMHRLVETGMQNLEITLQGKSLDDVAEALRLGYTEGISDNNINITEQEYADGKQSCDEDFQWGQPKISNTAGKDFYYTGGDLNAGACVPIVFAPSGNMSDQRCRFDPTWAFQFTVEEDVINSENVVTSRRTVQVIHDRSQWFSHDECEPYRKGEIFMPDDDMTRELMSRTIMHIEPDSNFEGDGEFLTTRRGSQKISETGWELSYNATADKYDYHIDAQGARVQAANHTTSRLNIWNDLFMVVETDQPAVTFRKIEFTLCFEFACRSSTIDWTYERVKAQEECVASIDSNKWTLAEDWPSEAQMFINAHKNPQVESLIDFSGHARVVFMPCIGDDPKWDGGDTGLQVDRDFPGLSTADSSLINRRLGEQAAASSSSRQLAADDDASLSLVNMESTASYSLEYDASTGRIVIVKYDPADPATPVDREYVTAGPHGHVDDGHKKKSTHDDDDDDMSPGLVALYSVSGTIVFLVLIGGMGYGYQQSCVRTAERGQKTGTSDNDSDVLRLFVPSRSIHNAKVV